MKGALAPRLPDTLNFTIPPGLIGNPTAVPKCESASFSTIQVGDSNLCPGNTAIGIASVRLIEPVSLGERQLSVPVFNLEPSKGEPARFGFEAEGSPVVLTTKLRTGSDYGVEVTVHEADETVEVLATTLTLWGDPSEASHNGQRGWECLQGGVWAESLEHPKPCPEHSADTEKSFLTMPTVCNQPSSSVAGETWPYRPENPITHNPEGILGGENATIETLSYSSQMANPFSGCNNLKLEPSISVVPEQTTASTPTGLDVKIKVPQESTVSSKGLAEADIAGTKLALPVGMTTNGSSANGLLTCTASEMGFSSVLEGEFGEQLEKQAENDNFSPAEATCPNQAKIGNVTIKTPLLEHELSGSVYLARANTGFAAPFHTPLGLYLVAEDASSGTRVKLAGEIQINPENGQLVSIFSHTPPLPFEELDIKLQGGQRASQATPAACGTYTAAAEFVPSSGSEPVERNSSFAISSGAGGSACPAPGTQPFGPSFAAGAESGQAGAFSPFEVQIGNPDGSQALKSVSVTEPKGAAAILASVTPCPVALATLPVPACPASSQIGVSTAYIGLGSEPVAVPGEVFLTTGYKGAPFGLLSVTDAEHVGATEGNPEGVFNLGKIGVMSTITVNETTAQATITSDPLPQFAPLPGQPGTSTGIPSQIKALDVNVNRPGFTFNPTNCEPLETTGVLSGYGPGGADAAVPVSSPFHASNCAALAFKPKIEVQVESNVSRLEGTGMKIKITATKGQANIGKTKLEFPKVIPSRLPTLHESCLDKTFEENPAKCGERSKIGFAIAKTPVLKSPLAGPVYLVSHGNAAFPDAEIVLQGEGIKLLLDGQTEISESGANKGVTISSFESVPDAPVETFEVNLPRKQYSAFSGYGNLCTEKPTMPTKFTGQNGAVTNENLKIDVLGCSGVLHETHESELAKLLKKCKKLKNHSKRSKCDAMAHKQVAAVSTCKKKNKGHSGKINACVAKARKKYPLGT